MNFTRVAEPEIFESRKINDPEEWIERFELFSRLNKWDDIDSKDFIQLYLGKKEVVWYKRNKNNFKSFKELKELFIQNYSNKELELLAWTKVNSIKQKDFLEIADMEMEMDSLFSKAKIIDEEVKFKCLLSALDPRFQRKVIERGIKTWKKAIDLVSESERLDVLTEDGHKMGDNKVSGTVPDPVREITKIHNSAEIEDQMYEAMVKKFDNFSINILSKVDSVLSKYKEPRVRNERLDELYRQGVCYNCKSPGHRRFECPDLRNFGNREERESNKSHQKSFKDVSYIDFHSETEDKKTENLEPADVFTAEKRSTAEVSNTGSSFYEGSKRVKLRPDPESNLELEKLAKQGSTVRRKMQVKLAEETKQFSIKEELENIYPKINLAQLIVSSPAVRSDITSMFKKVELKEVNQLKYESTRTTNCKALVSIFGSYCWAVIDTGAALSVVTPSLMRKWGIEPDEKSSQIVVTADGSKHATGGKVTSVPIVICGYTFPADLVVMDRKEDTLILGTDWFLEYSATINLQNQELILPLKDVDIVLSLSTKTKILDTFDEETELYVVIKEEVVEKTEDGCYYSEEIEKVRRENEDIFISELEELTQTDVIEHRIELKQSLPIKQRPYRIPHNLQKLKICQKLCKNYKPVDKLTQEV
ncbi:hypothetical protein AYI70_g9060 [Smittium culicis]|uniref:CCHC-type domain-containing protein n=1 Tax=Smittium culicis TaxID=133412 RepID=A0A1R1XD28_9FUNG|nr:hypothetical protein AYI70_g9060 [Smittium culicis]